MQHRNPSHADHDLALIAAHAAGDLADAERARAQSLVDSCDDCAELLRDLDAIARATRALPRLARAPRDFRLTPEHASGLRRGSWLRTLLVPFGAAWSATRPVAAAFTSLGVIGLLVVTVLPGLLGSAASLGPAQERDVTGAQASGAPAYPASGPGAAPGPIATAGAPDDAFGPKGVPSNGPEIGVAGDPVDAAAPAPASPLLIGSVALLAIGLGLYGLRFASRRLR